MTKEQARIIFKKNTENILIADEVEKLKFSSLWCSGFTELLINNGSTKLSISEKMQMQEIAEVNSMSVLSLMNRDKKVSLQVLYLLSIKFSTEKYRKSTTDYILENGVLESYEFLKNVFQDYSYSEHPRNAKNSTMS